jgi:ankyrin repeat protein
VLHVAAKGGHDATVSMLVEASGADKDAAHEDGRTAVNFAAQYGHETTIRMLFETLGADNSPTERRANCAALCHQGWPWKLGQDAL